MEEFFNPEKQGLLGSYVLKVVDSSKHFTDGGQSSLQCYNILSMTLKPPFDRSTIEPAKMGGHRAAVASA
jgi:hypothetical protein